MRKVRPGEVPRFGSVWQWREDGMTRYIALGVRKGMFQAVRLPDGVVVDYMGWTERDGTTLPEWRCIDEGPGPESHLHMDARSGVIKGTRFFVDGKDVTDEVEIKELRLR